MLNMLYCIVFDSYAFVKTRAGAPLTLYAQIRDAAATARETRGFVNLYTLIVQLEEPTGRSNDQDGGVLNWGYPKWLVGFCERENPMDIWMITRGIHGYPYFRKPPDHGRSSRNVFRKTIREHFCSFAIPIHLDRRV